jgi:soluble lytic murein transglycosylase-like protein
MRALASLLVSALALNAPVALADLWAYVDEQGQSHVANHQVDARYKLFFKGATTLDAPERGAVERERAIEALAGTPLYAHATDPARTRPFEQLIAAHARSNGLDPALVKAVVAVESAFDARAVSRKGAIGLMQVLPDTGERYGLRAGAERTISDQLFDPATNLRIGTRYLRDLLARFAGDLAVSLAAYNAGEGVVAMHDNRVPPFGETLDYVEHVRQLYAIYRPDAPPAPRVRFLNARPRADVAARQSAHR